MNRCDARLALIRHSRESGKARELTGRFTQATGAYRTAITFESGYEKASSSLARIAGRVDDPSAPAIDFKVLAGAYAARIKG